MTKVLILTTVHYYKDARIFFKEIPVIKNLVDELVYMAKIPSPTSYYENGIQFYPLPPMNNCFERFFKLQFFAYKNAIKIKPDILHFHDPELLFLALLIKLRIGTKIIFDIHENVSVSFQDNLWIPNFLKPLIKHAYSVIERSILKKFDALIIAENSYRKIYGPKAQLVRNFPLLISKEMPVKNFESNLNFVYAGGIMERRGAVLMLKVFLNLLKKREDLFFHIIGPIVPQTLEKELLKIIKENKIENKVKLYGRLPLEEVYSVLKKCHLGFSLMKPIGNYLESLSTKIFDYMLFGVVPIVSDFPIYKEYVQEPETGILVDYNDLPQIVAKVEEIIFKPELLKKMGLNGYKNVLKYWNWDIEKENLIKVYKDLILHNV
jgi:glycosyltransferase involved in cell wall biosynthesis